METPSPNVLEGEGRGEGEPSFKRARTIGKTPHQLLNYIVIETAMYFHRYYSSLFQMSLIALKFI